MKYVKSNDGGEKRVRGINIVDVALIVVMLCLVLVAVEYFTSFSLTGIGGTTRTIEYTLEFESVDGEMAKNVAVRDAVLSASGHKSLGQVSAVSEQPAVAYVYDPTAGALAARELPADAQGHAPVKLRVTVRAEASYHEGDGFSINGVRISIGDIVGVSMDGFSGSGKCVSIYNAG